MVSKEEDETYDASELDRNAKQPQDQAVDRSDETSSQEKQKRCRPQRKKGDPERPAVQKGGGTGKRIKRLQKKQWWKDQAIGGHHGPHRAGT